MKVLSLFDGMACGAIAFGLAGVDIESYDAYEIDKYAIKTAQHNFPMIKEHGDVFDADFTQYEGVDFLIGGSPCTYWSIAQTKNRETVASGMGWELFSQYVRALHEAKPKYFIYENNKSMSKQIRASIDEAFGFEAVLINSALVSAQNRQRLYWVGKRNEDGTYSKVNVEQPADRGILLKDVLDSAVARDLTCNDKSYTLTASYDGACAWNTIERHQRNMVAEPVCLRYERTEEAKRCRKAYEAHEIKHGYNELNELHPRPDGKTNTLTTVEKDNRVAEPISYCTDKNIEHLMRNFGSKGKIVDEESKTPTLMAAAGMGGGNHIYYADSIAEPINVTANEKAFCVTSRYYKGFGNNPGKCLEKHRDSMVAEPINVTADGKSQTLKAQYCKNSVANFCCYSSTYGASGVAEPVNVTADGKAQCLRATCYKDGIRNIIANEVDKKTGVAEPILKDFPPFVDKRINNIVEKVGYYPGMWNPYNNAEITGKAPTQTTQCASWTSSSTCVIAEPINDIRCANSGRAGAKTGLYAIPTMPVKEATSKGYAEIECGDCVDLSMPNSKTRRGRNMADKSNCMQTSNEFYQYVGYVIEFDDDGRPIKAIGKDGKEITIYEVRDGKITIKGKQYPIKLKDGYYIIRKLTVSECKRLQTVPEWYEFPVSNSQAYKMLGNGWTCEVICHLINSCLKPADALPGQIGLW